MAWNEPGSGKQKDPWRDSGGGGGNGGGSGGPDMDDIMRRVKGWFGQLGGGSGGVGIAVIGLVLAWLLFDSWVQVNANQSGVVLRFGEFNRLLPPGFNMKWPGPVENVIKVEAKNIRSTSDQVRMLSNDENIVVVDFNVQYEVNDPRKFLFGVQDPDGSLAAVAESAVRTVVGASTMDMILSGQRAELMINAKRLLQETMDQYGTGLSITELNFQNIRPPQEVREAFDDANRALQDKQRAEELAKAYASQILPEARGDASKTRVEAEGYKAERVARAKGESDRFNLIEQQFRAAPEVTRKRLYLETMQQVVADTPKIIDGSNGKNVLYVPVPGETRSGGAPPIAGVVGEATVAPTKEAR
ncbi:MAG: FtsH protease activity modulator HflK [Dokdonella sp.]